MATFTGLALNKDQISYYDYHWFWGLRLNKTVIPNNISCLLKDLIIHEKRLLDLINQYTSIGQRNFIVRFFYRLFNIDNFALNTHILAAAKAMNEGQLEPEKQNMQSKTSQIYTDTPLWNLRAKFANYVANIRKQFYPDGPSLQNGAQVAEEQADSISKSDKVNNQNIQTNEFMVDARMQSHLKLLNINKKNGDTILLADVRRAYRKAANEGPYRHTDKGGSKNAFCQLTDAVDSLTLLFFPEKSDAVKLSDLWRDTEETLDRTEALLAVIKVEQAETRMNLGRLNATLDKTKASLDMAEAVLDKLEASLDNNEAVMDKAEIDHDVYILQLKKTQNSNKQHSLGNFETSQPQGGIAQECQEPKNGLIAQSSQLSSSLVLTKTGLFSVSNPPKVANDINGSVAKSLSND